MTKKHMKPVIELRGLKKRFGVGNAENFALGGIDLTINQGEFIAIMGPSGCGKTTLLNILGLLDRATEGSYLLDGKPVHKFGTMKKLAFVQRVLVSFSKTSTWCSALM